LDSSISFGLRSDLMVGILSKIFKYNNNFVTERGGRINRVSKGPLRTIMTLLDKYLVSKICAGAISNSELGKDYLIKNGFNASKIKVIPNGIKISNYERKKIINKNYTIGYIGRLEEFKNVEVLIKAFNIIIKQNNTIQKLLIAGDGTLKDKLKNLTKEFGLKNKIEFIGFTHDLKNYYESIDIGVIPSKSTGTESFPNVLLEHWKYKVPVLLSDIKTIRTITKGINKAVYFNPDDHNDLAKKIINLVSNKKQMSLMEKEANMYLKNNFDLNVVINKYHDFLKNNINGFRF
jgi:glycosyltransferase involved in cell wall biosynthesis